MSLRPGVVSFRPRSQPFVVAVEAFRAGRFEVALGALLGHGTVAAEVLRSRALLRLGRVAAAWDILARVPADALDHHDRGEILMLLAVALTRLGRNDEAAETLEIGHVFVYAAANSALEAEYDGWAMSRSFALGHFDEVARIAEGIHRIEPFFERASNHFVSLEHSRARAFEYSGLVAATREDYASQATLLRAALDELKRAKGRDVWYESILLANLSFFVREFDSPNEAAFVRARCSEIEWNAELAPQQFQIYQSLGWCSALRGDHIGAFRDLRAAANVAPIVPQKIMATLDRAYLARELRQGLVAREELEYAESLAATVDWNAVPGEHICALLHLAEGLGAAEPARARHFFERYRSLKAKLPPQFLARFDRRARAEELVADATIARAEANVARASMLFLEAFEIWNALGYRWRAALAACELAELGAGDAFDAYARSEAARRPQSWLARRTGEGAVA